MQSGDRVTANDEAMNTFGIFVDGHPGVGTITNNPCKAPWNDCVWVIWDARPNDPHMINRSWLKLSEKT